MESKLGYCLGEVGLASGSLEEVQNSPDDAAQVSTGQLLTMTKRCRCVKGRRNCRGGEACGSGCYPPVDELGPW